MKATDKNNLITKSYNTKDKFEYRVRFNRLSNPKININEKIMKLINFNKTKTILDAGCGYGELLIFLRESGFTGKLNGIDLSEGMLKTPKQINLEKDLNIDFQQADLKNLPFPDNCFDIIICKHVLHHIENQEKAISELYRCLKKDGLLIIALNSERNKPKLFEFERYFGKKHNFKTHHGQQIMSSEKIEKHLKKFKDVKTKYYESIIEIKDSQLYTNYFLTFSELYEPEQNKNNLRLIEKELNEIVSKDIKKNNAFIEKLVISITTCKK